MESLIHGAFLTATVVIALIPLALVGRGPALIWLLWAVVWGSLAVLTARGVFVFDPQILRMVAHFGGQIVCGVALFFFFPQVRRVVRSVSLSSLVGLQVVRVIGGFFLIGAAMGEVSWTFGVIAGCGDILVGVAALRTVRAMREGHSADLARRHTALGLTDFTVAISTSILTGAVIGGPYILIPLFLVPMAVLAHLAVLDRVGITATEEQRQGV